MSDYTLGQRVRFTRPMTRRGIRTREVKVESSAFGAPYTYTKMINREWQGNEHAAEAEGIIIGQRTLSNGYAQWDEDGSQYSMAEHFTAYLIVTGLRSAPVHVLPEHIEPA
ncbi:hypothetical protein [Arthrobacter sp. UYCu723]